MSKALQLEVVSSGGTFTFDVEGEFFPRLEPVYKDGSHPLQLEEIRYVWEVRGLRLRGASPADTASLWTRFLALETHLATRTAHPTYARMVRDPSGANVELWRIGDGSANPPAWEKFRIETVEGEPDPEFRDASFRTVVYLTMRLSAVRKFADANSVVGFQQTVDVSYPNGLKQVSWRTRVTTREGTSAVTVATTIGALDVNDFGGDYGYDEETNGPDGVALTYTDAEENPPGGGAARTPTVAEVVSAVKQYGISVGVTSPGSSPSDFDYTITTHTSPDEEFTTTTAAASGPGASSWVELKKPATYNESEVTHNTAKLVSRGVWTTRRKRTKSKQNRWTIEVEITGGYPQEDYDPIMNGLPPVLFVGAIQPWKATVTIDFEDTGTAKTADMKLPGLPAHDDPWRLDRNASSETEPVLTEKAEDVASNKYTRTARLVFWATRAPIKPLLEQINEQPQVVSYYLKG